MHHIVRYLPTRSFQPARSYLDPSLPPPPFQGSLSFYQHHIKTMKHSSSLDHNKITKHSSILDQILLRRLVTEMEGEDPSPSGANTHRGDPGDLDTAPRLSTREQLDDMVDLLTDEWRKTKVKHNNASNCSAEILAPSFDELQDFDFEEDTITKVRISTVPQLVTSKVNNLREWDRIGHPYLTDLISLVKEGLAKYPFSASIASGEVEGAKDKAAIFAGMVSTQTSVPSCVLLF